MCKVVLITGASSRLGRKLSHFLDKRGFVVYSGYRSDKAKIKSGTPILLDVVSDKDCKSAIARIVKKQGKIDVLINNAGYTVVGPSEKQSSQDFIDILNTNTVGALRLIKLVLPYMKKQKSGKIINITSLNGLVSFPNYGIYSASKHALEALGSALYYELAGDNVWFTNIAPGAIAMGKSINKAPHKPAREKFFLLSLLLPMVTPIEISEKVEKIIKSPKPPASVLMGRDAKTIVLLKRLLPSVVWNRLMLYIWSK